MHSRNGLSIPKQLAIEEDNRRNKPITAFFQVILEVLAQGNVSLFNGDTVRLKQLLQSTTFLCS
jgi:hypothetical protein